MDKHLCGHIKADFLKSKNIKLKYKIVSYCISAIKYKHYNYDTNISYKFSLTKNV